MRCLDRSRPRLTLVWRVPLCRHHVRKWAGDPRPMTAQILRPARDRRSSWRAASLHWIGSVRDGRRCSDMKTWSPTSSRVPPSFNYTSSVLGATNRPVPMLNSALLALRICMVISPSTVSAYAGGFLPCRLRSERSSHQTRPPVRCLAIPRRQGQSDHENRSLFVYQTTCRPDEKPIVYTPRPGSSTELGTN